MTDTAQAAATVTITVTDDEATALLDALSHMAEAYDLAVDRSWMNLYQKLGDQMSTAAPPPAPSDSLDGLFAETRRLGGIVRSLRCPREPRMHNCAWECSVEFPRQMGRQISMIQSNGHGDTEVAALRNALAAGRSAGEGTS